MKILKKKFKILDARSKNRFLGIDPEPRPGIKGGSIEGSSCLPLSELINPQNNTFLDKVKLNKSLKVTNSLEDLSKLDVLFIVVPTQYIQATLKPLKKIIKKNCILVNCAKGIDIKSTSLISEVINKILPSNKLAIMSGPNFALEIALGKPTASLIATQKLSDAKFIANLISSKTFRPYLSNDIIGAQICGAMKNIYAIGCGIIVGKNFGENAVASVISRSFAEI